MGAGCRRDKEVGVGLRGEQIGLWGCLMVGWGSRPFTVMAMPKELLLRVDGNFRLR